MDILNTVIVVQGNCLLISMLDRLAYMWFHNNDLNLENRT